KSRAQRGSHPSGYRYYYAPMSRDPCVSLACRFWLTSPRCYTFCGFDSQCSQLRISACRHFQLSQIYRPYQQRKSKPQDYASATQGSRGIVKVKTGRPEMRSHTSKLGWQFIPKPGQLALLGCVIIFLSV